MLVREFVDRFNRIRTELKAGQPTPEVATAMAALTADFRRAFSREALEAALAENAAVPTGLEESLTTLTMLWMARRGNA